MLAPVQPVLRILDRTEPASPIVPAVRRDLASTGGSNPDFYPSCNEDHDKDRASVHILDRDPAPAGKLLGQRRRHKTVERAV